MTALDFIKMHGLGNDFVVIDAQDRDLSLSREDVRAIANRHTGVGCDQLIVMEAPLAAQADVFMRIYNPDGHEAGACGNATRCVAALIMHAKNTDHAVVETVSGRLKAQDVGDGRISVDMGQVRLEWQDLPLAHACDTRHLDITAGPLHDAVGVNVGNPHAVFIVDDAEAVDIATLGPRLETDPLFPERTNVEIVQVLSRTHIRMRVWERRAGITLACGTGACAALVATARRGLTERTANVDLDGGVLNIEWRRDDHVIMTGPVARAFTGSIEPTLLAKGAS